MKVMYVSGKPATAEELQVDLEVTELQSRFMSAKGEPVQFIPLPKLSFEQFGLEIGRHSPDVLHISAHSDLDHLALGNASGASIELTGPMLRAFLNVEHPPRLVYLNACNSRAIAEVLTSVVPMAIGTTASISNRTARAAAVLFYDRLLAGASVHKAFEASKATTEALQSRKASSVLYKRRGIDAQKEWLHQIPRIVAKFAEGDTKPDRDGYYSIETGVFGCPGNTSQLVLFTDDKTFVAGDDEDDDDEDDDYEDDDDEELDEEYFLAGQLCRVIRGSPVRNIIWSEQSESVYGDYRMFAVGVTGSGDVFTASSTLCVAIEAYYQSNLGSREGRTSSKAINAAVSRLRAYDGALAPSSGPIVPSRKSRVTPKASQKPSRASTASKSGKLYRRKSKK